VPTQITNPARRGARLSFGDIETRAGAPTASERTAWGGIAAHLLPMGSDAVISAFWAAMQSNDWERAASHLASECVVDWPCSGERIVGRADFVAIQARYPTSTGRWSFEMHRLIVAGDTAVTEATVTDGEQSARVVCFSESEGDHIVRQT
jgi:limonene-1,2-epoxide hydrolase